MCGIYASISTRGFQIPSPGLKHLLCKRGPDHVGEVQAEIEDDGLTYYLSFTSTVLALRGGHVTAQPFIDPQSGSVLCWNGEAWKIGPETVAGNDGQKVFAALLGASTTQGIGSESTSKVVETLNSISGPFAFVFFDNIHKQLFFGRDRLGRRSLLHNSLDDSKSIEFSSTADPARGLWEEVEADAIYVLSCRKEDAGKEVHRSDPGLISASILPLHRYAWGVSGQALQSASRDMMEISSVPSLGVFNRSLPLSAQVLNAQTSSVRLLRDHLCESLKLRILNIPEPPGFDQSHNVRVAVLFSGGLDCTVLARMAHDLLPPEQHIDLVNVAFENPRVIQAAENAPKSKKQAKMDTKSQNDTKGQNGATFTGDPVRISPYESCPDRETGRKAFQELQEVCPNRIWRFVAVNIPYTETMAHRETVVSLIHPHNTEMDLSIAYALYFAARGTGIASSNLDPSPAPYSTPARVLLSGLGADEMFGGYTRHATAFNRNGFPGLLDELELDVNRLGKRNLGRDDRVISHWGREARFPFLDESLVKWAVECPIWEKCGFQTIPSQEQEVPQIEPGKKVLRLLAYELGMHSVAQEKKRAIQFGARTAKMVVGKTKGTSLIS